MSGCHHAQITEWGFLRLIDIAHLRLTILCDKPRFVILEMNYPEENLDATWKNNFW